MTKYQEKTFKDYIGEIEYLKGNYRDFLNGKMLEEALVEFARLRNTRIAFFNWFKKQVK